MYISLINSFYMLFFLQNLLLEQGYQHAMTLYTWRCCSRAIPTVKNVFEYVFLNGSFHKYISIVYFQYIVSPSERSNLISLLIFFFANGKCKILFYFTK
jgi:hypothetical protein